MGTLIAVLEIQGRPEGLLVGESAASLANEVYSWTRKVREAGFIPEVYYWYLSEGKTLEDYP